MIARAASSFTLFETGQVRPLALSPDGTRLFAVNTPDNRLEIFNVSASGLLLTGSVPVGLEPLAVSARTNSEVWVVNHLSDSISIVDVGAAMCVGGANAGAACSVASQCPGGACSTAAHVTRTLLVGDEPRDVVFANGRAFITSAHRGQNTPLHTAKCDGGSNDGAVCTAVSACPGGACAKDDLAQPGVGRADVWVFDGANPGAGLGGTPDTIITLFADTPRALTVSPDGNTVYAAAFHSGNQTTTINEGAVPNGGSSTVGPNDCSAAPGGLPAPNKNVQNLQGPEVGLIVKFDGTHWRDELNRCWDSAVKFSLPDKDVFKIDATQNPPIAVAGPTGFYPGVGTVLFNMVANPVTGKIYVTNTEAINDVRFEGPGIFAAGLKPPGEPLTVRGHLAESRITVLDGATVTPRHLNKHINYTACCAATPNAENDAALAFPVGMAVSSDGLTLYVAAFGSSKIGVYNTVQLETDTFVPSPANEIAVTGGGPTGLVLDEPHTRLYVLTRFDNSISIVSTATGMQTAHLGLHNPEPANVVAGRSLLYDAKFTSSHGDSACASCHIFGDFDSLAWDLGNPDDTVLTNPGPFRVGPLGSPPAIYTDFHPMKGPMTTQSLRGMANHGPMHWRGDRTGGNDAASFQPDSGTFNEDAAFKKFNVAFPGLLGRNAQLQPAEMQAFTDFILQVTYPPNPIRNLDNSLTSDELTGRNFFLTGPVSDTFQRCSGCHVLQPSGNSSFGVAAPGFFGTDGEQSFEGETQHFKIPHLRNMYQKVGMFGMPASPFFNAGDNGFTGDQVRGFGFLHDGSTDTLFRFHNAIVFNQSGINPTGIPAGAAGDPLRRQIDSFMMAFDTNLAPIVGQQTTRSSTNGGVTDPRITLLIARADAGECDVVAKGVVGGEDRGFLYVGSGQFVSDRAADAPLPDATLRGLANTAGQEITYTCVPRGSGSRIGVDRDGDSFGDSDEIDAGSDPADPGSTPTGGVAICSSLSPFVFQNAKLRDSKGQLSLTAKDVPLGSYSQQTVSVTADDGGGVIYAGNVPGVSIAPKGTGFKFSAPRGSTGITRVTVKARGSTPTLFKVMLKTTSAWTAPAADESTATTLVTLNVGGQCFQGNATKLLP
jgi:DNA-binding beta-propeller fold protein YncE